MPKAGAKPLSTLQGDLEQTEPLRIVQSWAKMVGLLCPSVGQSLDVDNL